MKLGVVLCATLFGCVPPLVVRDQESACRVARDMMRQPMSTADMVELTAPFPKAYPYAVRAYQARLATLVMTGLGAAGLGGALLTGFVADQSNPAVRTGLYTDIGVTIGLGVGTLISGFTYLKSSQRALSELDAETRAECGQ